MVHLHSIRRAALWCGVFISCGSVATSYVRTQSDPTTPVESLPELDSFLARIKENLRSDRLLLSQYTYKEKETEHHLDKKGKVKKTEVRVYEVYPSLEEDMTYRRLISKNGELIEDKKLEKQDKKHNKKVEQRARKLAKEKTSDRERRLAKETEEEQKEQDTIDELMQIYEYSMLGRETIDGHSTILLRFTPVHGYKPKTDDGKMLKKFRGRAWFSEQDYQLVQVEVELIENIRFGLGLVARLHKGAQLVFKRRRINNEIWLPAEAYAAGSARVLLLKVFRIEAVSEFSDYKKFTVASSVTFSEEVPP